MITERERRDRGILRKLKRQTRVKEKKRPKMARFKAFIIEWMGSFICSFVHSFKNHSFIQEIFSES